jgi:hypothetical protein
MLRAGATLQLTATVIAAEELTITIITVLLLCHALVAVTLKCTVCFPLFQEGMLMCTNA